MNLFPERLSVLELDSNSIRNSQVTPYIVEYFDEPPEK